jgi:hypothetical protein
MEALGNFGKLGLNLLGDRVELPDANHCKEQFTNDEAKRKASPITRTGRRHYLAGFGSGQLSGRSG